LAQNLFKDKGAQCASCLGLEHAPFGPSSKGASGLNDIAIPSRDGHIHAVSMNFAEKWGGDGDCGWEDDFVG
jgi:hypothetical protein